MRAMSGLRRALGEPLLQFIVMGALLFAGYRLVHPERPAKVEDNRIELTAADVRQLEIVWTAQWHRAPTQDELQGLVESRVREEILYREALALGLERGDTIIKRRLAQKMEFLADDVSAVRTPSVEELRAWYSRNPARFADPGRRSFRHLYFSADRRGDRAQQDATRALVKLGRTPVRCNRALGHRRRVHVPGALRRSHAGAGGSHLRQSLRRGRAPAAGRHVAGADRVGPRLASGARHVRDARSRSGLRRDRRPRSRRRGWRTRGRKRGVAPST